MINLYIFNETRRAAIYGVGTYIHELIAALKGSEINVCVVHLRSEKPNNEQAESDGVRYIHIPPQISYNSPLDWSQQNDLHYRHVVSFLRWKIKDSEKLIFLLNYTNSGTLAEELKKTFECKIVTVVHFLQWCLDLNGNITLLRNILAARKTNLNEVLIK